MAQTTDVSPNPTMVTRRQVMSVPIDAITIGHRYRNDLGNLAELEASITTVGLLQPIVITPDHMLIAGLRRLSACRALGWPSIPAVVAASLDDARLRLIAERDENTCREPLTIEAQVALADALEPYERAEAKKRFGGRPKKGETPSNFDEVSKGRALDKVAEAVGLGYDTLTKARAVLDAAALDPALEPIKQRMIETGKVDPAYRAVRETQTQAADVRPGTSNKLGVHFSSETPEHYTPADLLARVVACLGAIDLDPCSNSHDKPNVPATTQYTRDDDGLAREWHGRVFMNPPYGREIDAWVTKLVAEHRAGRTVAALALVPSRTDTQWFAEFRDFWFCNVRGRLTFVGNNDPAPFPSVVFYLGDDEGAFYHHFVEIGDIWQRVERGVSFAE
jgi:ParB-like chromosome segregation protein Spo0J